MTGGGSIQPAIIADGYGGAIVAWDDKRVAGFADDVYALRIGGSGPTAVEVSLVSVTAEPGIAHLEWLVKGATVSQFRLERHTEKGLWESIATLAPSGTGRVMYEDRSVSPERLAYRLSYLDEGVNRSTPEVWVDIPSAYVLSLSGFAPNPTSSANLSVSFTLPKQAQGSLALYDVAGREIASEDLRSLGAGRHTLRLQPHRRVAAGVYWMRLTHQDQALIKRGAIVR